MKTEEISDARIESLKQNKGTRALYIFLVETEKMLLNLRRNKLHLITGFLTNNYGIGRHLQKKGKRKGCRLCRRDFGANSLDIAYPTFGDYDGPTGIPNVTLL